MKQAPFAWKDIQNDFEELWVLPKPTKGEPFPKVPSTFKHPNMVLNIGKHHSETLGNFGKTGNEKSLRALLELAGEFHLSAGDLITLMNDLSHISVEYAWDKSFGTTKPEGKAQSFLNLIQKNLQRLTKYNTKASKAGQLADRAGMTALGKAFQIWAIKRLDLVYWIDQRLGSQTRRGEWLPTDNKGRSILQHSDDGIKRLKRWRKQFASELEQVGVALETPIILPESGGEEFRLYYSSFDAAKHVSTFFGLAKLLSTFAKQFVSGNPKIGRGLTASDNLVGKTLPSLYAKYTGKKFGFSKPYSFRLGGSEKAKNTTGVRFSNLCMLAMGLEPMEPETMRTKKSEVKKGSKRPR